MERFTGNRLSTRLPSILARLCLGASRLSTSSSTRYRLKLEPSKMERSTGAEAKKTGWLATNRPSAWNEVLRPACNTWRSILARGRGSSLSHRPESPGALPSIRGCRTHRWAPWVFVRGRGGDARWWEDLSPGAGGHQPGESNPPPVTGAPLGRGSLIRWNNAKDRRLQNELAFICFAFRNYIASSTLNLIVSTPLRSAPSANCRALCAREKSQSPSDLIIRLVKRLPSKLSSSSVRSAR